jgi:glycosyltransferase involved in cell wall biosynthesis
MTLPEPLDGQRAKRASREELDLLLLGPVPPPFGGISVHISRLVPLLERAGLSVAVLNHFGSTDAPRVRGALKKNPLNYYLLPKRFRHRMLHYHHSRWPHLIAVALGKGKSQARYIVTLHAGDVQKHLPQLVSRVPFVALLTRWALRRFDLIVVVEPSIAAAIRNRVDERRVELVPAFIEPGADELGSYDAALETFVRGAGSLLVVPAYSIQFRPDGGELYGVDTAVDAFIELAAKLENLRMAVFMARKPERPRSREHLGRLEEKLERAGVRDRVMVVFGLPLAAALRSNATFVRPTRADGDAVSIREAISAGVPVVASDVVARPPGVVTFPVADSDQLATALLAVVNRQTASLNQAGLAPPATGGSFAERLIALYRSELERAPSGDGAA